MSVNPSDRHSFGMVSAHTATPCSSEAYGSSPSRPIVRTPTSALSLVEDIVTGVASAYYSWAYGNRVTQPQVASTPEGKRVAVNRVYGSFRFSTLRVTRQPDPSVYTVAK